MKLRNAGMTLVEILVAVTILSVALLVFIGVALASRGAIEKGNGFTLASQAAEQRIAACEATGFESLTSGTTTSTVPGLRNSTITTTIGPLDGNAANNGLNLKQVDVTVTWAASSDATPQSAGNIRQTTLISKKIAPLPPAFGTGLTAQFYNDPVGSTYFNTLVVTRVDPGVNFNWGTGAPDRSVQAEYFSARWSGQIQAPVTGTYTFYTYTDDGVRLWVNGSLIIDDWNTGPLNKTSSTVSLVAGQRYAIKMECFERTGNAAAILSWSYPGQTQQIIPGTVLFP